MRRRRRPPGGDLPKAARAQGSAKPELQRRFRFVTDTRTDTLVPRGLLAHVSGSVPPHYLKRIFFLSHRYRSPALTEGLLFTNRHSFTATTPVSIVCNLFHFWGGGDPPLFLKFHLLFDLSSTYKLHVEQLAF